ncbi:hypothetical protein E2320_014417, partial [Naja naja]
MEFELHVYFSRFAFLYFVIAPFIQSPMRHHSPIHSPMRHHSPIHLSIMAPCF